MTPEPEPAPIDHAHVARCANTIIDLDAMNPSREDTIHTLAPLVSRAYLARSAEIDALSAENARLREALEQIVSAAIRVQAAQQNCDSDVYIKMPPVARNAAQTELGGAWGELIGARINAQRALDARGGAA